MTVRELTAAVTVSTTPAYASGDTLGTVAPGYYTFAEACSSSYPRGYIVGAIVRLVTAAAGVPFELWVFKQPPSNSTFTDNGALTVNASDLANLVKVVPIPFIYPASTGSIHQSPDLAVPFDLGYDAGNIGYSKLYGVLVIRGAWTAVASTDIRTLSLFVDQQDEGQ